MSRDVIFIDEATDFSMSTMRKLAAKVPTSPELAPKVIEATTHKPCKRPSRDTYDPAVGLITHQMKLVSKRLRRDRLHEQRNRGR